MQWKKHCSSKACQLAGGGAGQEGGAGLRGADAGGPHQEPGEITSLADNLANNVQRSLKSIRV